MRFSRRVLGKLCYAVLPFGERPILARAIIAAIFVLAVALLLLLGYRYMTVRLRTLVKRSAEGEAFIYTERERLAFWPLEISEAEGYIHSHPDWTSYHILLVLRSNHPGAYARIPPTTKAAILSSALGHVSELNDWGYLEEAGSWENFSGEALVAVGPVALPYLRPLLDNNQPAWLGGSKEATLSHIYQFRRADFAYNYVCLILGLPRKFPRDPHERDKEIERVKRQLDEILANQEQGSETP